MGKRITTWLDRVFDSIHWRLVGLGLKDPKSSTAADFYVFLTLVCLALSVHPLLCYASISQDPHVMFWMGPELQQANLLVLASLLVLILAVFIIQWVQAPSGVVRGLVFAVFLATGGLIAGLGVHVFQSSRGTSGDLVYHCGSSGTMTQRLEAEWLRLLQFHEGCVAERGRVSMQQCPGFADMLVAPHATFAGYMQEMEMDLGCSGFCHFWAAPLFNFNAAAGTRCASALGERMGRVGLLVGLPMLLSGVALEVLGAVLVGYDHL